MPRCSNDSGDAEVVHLSRSGGRSRLPPHAAIRAASAAGAPRLPRRERSTGRVPRPRPRVTGRRSPAGVVRRAGFDASGFHTDHPGQSAPRRGREPHPAPESQKRTIEFGHRRRPPRTQIEVVGTHRRLLQHGRVTDPRHPIGQRPSSMLRNEIPDTGLRHQPQGIESSCRGTAPLAVADAETPTLEHRGRHHREITVVAWPVEPAGGVDVEPVPPQLSAGAQRTGNAPNNFDCAAAVTSRRPRSSAIDGTPSNINADVSSPVMPPSFDCQPSSNRIPPPGPLSVHNGTPAADNAVTSRYTVRTDTPSSSASCCAVAPRLPSRRSINSTSRLDRIPRF